MDEAVKRSLEKELYRQAKAGLSKKVIKQVKNTEILCNKKHFS